MNDITVIILTFNEEMHIERCINSVRNIANRVILIDSYSDDKTSQIAEKLGAEIFKRKWPGNQANQLNWALENISIKSKWILRLDADEYLTDKLSNEINQKLSSMDENVSHIFLKRETFFLGSKVRFGGTTNIELLRMWKNGLAICEDRLMDEHMIALSGDGIIFNNLLIDDSLRELHWWISKHNDYSSREVISILNERFNFYEEENLNDNFLGSQSEIKRSLKSIYSKFPLFVRPFLYFIYRYFLMLGFLGGYNGLIRHFLQAFWYRFLIDAKLFEIQMKCGNDKKKIAKYILDNWKINVEV